MADKENREHPRYRLSLSVTLGLSDGEFAKAQAANISMGGMCIMYGAPANEGLVLDILFDLPFSKEFKRIIARGKVVRSIFIGSKSAYEIAFSFESFAKDSKTSLEDYIELRSRQGLVSL